MGPARLIAAKDIKLRIRDRSAIILGVIAPLGLAFIFNLILGGVVEGEFVPVFSVTNLDAGAVSEGFVAVLDEIDAEGIIEVSERPSTIAEAEDLAEEGTVSAAIIIPAGFSEAIQAGEPVTMTVIANPDNPVSAEVALAITEGFASEVRTAQLAVLTAVGTSGGSLTPAEIGQLAEAASAGLPEAITVGAVETSTKELDLATFFAASMSVFFLFFTVSFGVNGLLEEQQQGTIRRLMAAPIPESSIITGKALVSFVLGMVSMTILIVASSLLIGADWGNPLGVALLVVGGVLAATGLMMVVAAFAKTPEQAGNLMAILAVGLGMLGGIFFPGSLGTGVLSYLAYISPHRWFLLGLGDLAGGDELMVILPSLLGLLAFAVVSWAIAMVGFRRKGLSV
jgi:ABC-2 type transport system permease protein